MKRVIIFLMIVGLCATSIEASRRYKKKNNQRSDGYTIYQVKRGDNLFSLAKRFHTTTKKLISINKLKKKTLIVGQSLIVPSKKVSSSSKKSIAKKRKRNSKTKKFIKYKVDKGDTIAYIAKRFHITRKEVAIINGLDLYKLPKTGKILKIPNYKYWNNKRERLKDLDLNSYKSSSKKPKFYVVKRGDNLFSIAKKFKVSIDKLKKSNNIKSNKFIKIGRKLKIPSKSYTQPTPQNTEISQNKDDNKVSKRENTKETTTNSDSKFYTVKEGDSFKKIAKKNGITLKKLFQLNNLTSKSKLKVGKKLIVKDSVSEKKSPKSKPKIIKKYRVKSGDTLWSIAKKHKMSIRELREMNNLGKKSVLLRGMVLKVAYDDEKIALAKNTKSKSVSKSTNKSVSKSKNKTVTKFMKSIKKSRGTNSAIVKNRVKTKFKAKTKIARKRVDNLRDIRVILRERQGRVARSVSVNNIIRTAKRYLGTRYVWGAEGPKGFDCSGFTQYVMKKSKGVVIPRVSRRQAYYGKYITRKNLKPGDLIFFDTSKRRRGYVNHVGIYIGNNKFIHASSARHRVIITSLNSPFYRSRFKWGRRIN